MIGFLPAGDLETSRQSQVRPARAHRMLTFPHDRSGRVRCRDVVARAEPVQDRPNGDRSRDVLEKEDERIDLIVELGDREAQKLVSQDGHPRGVTSDEDAAFDEQVHTRPESGDLILSADRLEIGAQAHFVHQGLETRTRGGILNEEPFDIVSSVESGGDVSHARDIDPLADNVKDIMTRPIGRDDHEYRVIGSRTRFCRGIHRHHDACR